MVNVSGESSQHDLDCFGQESMAAAEDFWQFWRNSFSITRSLGNIFGEHRWRMMKILALQLVWKSSETWVTLVLQLFHQVLFPWWISWKSMFVRLSWFIMVCSLILFSAQHWLLPTSLSGLAQSGSFLHTPCGQECRCPTSVTLGAAEEDVLLFEMCLSVCFSYAPRVAHIFGTQVCILYIYNY